MKKKHFYNLMMAICVISYLGINIFNAGILLGIAVTIFTGILAFCLIKILEYIESKLKD